QEKARLEKENQAQQAEIQALRRYVEVLAELYRSAQNMAAQENHLDMLDRLLQRVIEVLEATDGSLSYLDTSSDELLFLLVHGQIRDQLPGYRLKSDVGVAGWVVSEGQPLIVNNPRQDWRFSLQVDREFAFLTRCILCVPVKLHKKPLGVIQILNKKNNNFTDTDAILASVLGHVAALALTEMNARSQLPGSHPS
ncbi:MAG: GAF domain-containing protein, partial [Chloroflexota bacterium]